MDDLLHSTPTVAAALTLGRDLVTLCAKGGFNLTKWLSSDPQVALELNKACGNVPAEPPPSSPVVLSDNAAHVLGLKWNFEADTLVVSRGTTHTLDSAVVITQRLVLSRVSSVFDPIGLVAPVTVVARLLLKDIWKRVGQHWDTELTVEHAQQFVAWHQCLAELGQISTPRRYFPFTPDSVELHVFGDASQEAFCAVAFVRAQDDLGVWHSSFVVGKARVAPMKCLTIPKLELQAALLAARIRQQLCLEMSYEFSRFYMWTDSSTVLQWLHNSDKKQPIFVANRVSEILDISSVDEWSHVPGEHNPADCATRGLTPSQLSESTWLTGPAFFRDATQWPPPADLGPPDCPVVSIVATTAQPEPTLVYDWVKASSFSKLTRIFAFVLRLLPKSRRALVTSLAPSADELARSENRLFFVAQRESFRAELRTLSTDVNVMSKSRLAPLSPFIGPDGLVRSKGRLSKMTGIPFQSRHPVLSRRPASVNPLVLELFALAPPS